MDREGFNLIDQEYQQDIKKAQKEVELKWELQYAGKKYSATFELNKKARAHDLQEKKNKIAKELEQRKARINAVHFPEKGRDTALNDIEQKEKVRESFRKAREKNFEPKKEQITDNSNKPTDISPRDKAMSHMKKSREHFNNRANEKRGR